MSEGNDKEEQLEEQLDEALLTLTRLRREHEVVVDACAYWAERALAAEKVASDRERSEDSS